MQDFTAIINEYIRSELLIVVPVIYVIARMLDSSKIQNERIPLILMLISVILAGFYTFATIETLTLQEVLLAVFSTLVQGVLLSGAAVFSGILIQMIDVKKKH